MTAADNQGQTDGPPETPSGNGAPGPDRTGYTTGSPREDEVSLLDILLVLARNKTLIVRTVLVFTLLGVTYALLASEEYTSSAKVVREAQAEGSGGLPSGIPSGALSSLGISLGGAASGLTPAAFPDVLQSREVRLAVVRDTFRFPDAERPVSYVDYVNRPARPLDIALKYTLWLPWTLKSALGDVISSSPAPAGRTEDGDLVIPTEEEDAALENISRKVNTSVDEETGLMTISVTAGGPLLASDLAKRFIDHFTGRVRTIRTEKVRERLQFVERRFQEAEEELETAEDRLAKFLERNQNPTTASLQFRQDRLRRQVGFKEQLYSNLQSQLTQTRLELQRQQPVVTVVENPVPPRDRSAPKRTLTVVISFVIGLIFGIFGAIIVSYFSTREKESKEKEKMKELKKISGLVK